MKCASFPARPKPSSSESCSHLESIPAIWSRCLAWKMTSPGSTRSRVHERFEQTFSAFNWWGLFLVSANPRAD